MIQRSERRGAEEKEWGSSVLMERWWSWLRLSEMAGKTEVSGKIQDTFGR